MMMVVLERSNDVRRNLKKIDRERQGKGRREGGKG
jgi:hypothetical protein